MTLSSDERQAIVIFRLQKAEATLEEAKGNMQMQYWAVVANRVYYAAYYAVSALLIYNGFDAQTHGGIIRLFGLHFISKGIISRESGRLYSKLFELRQTGDYDDVYMLSKEDVDNLIEPTQNLINEVRVLMPEIF